jgi:hypothetical protein
MVLTVSSALSLVTGLVCHHRRRNLFRQLDASVGASGPHDFAVRKLARSSVAPPRPSHPNPTFVTIAKRPLCVGRDSERCRSDLGQKRMGIFLRRGLDRQMGDLPDGQNQHRRRALCLMPSSSFPDAQLRICGREHCTSRLLPTSTMILPNPGKPEFGRRILQMCNCTSGNDENRTMSNPDLLAGQSSRPHRHIGGFTPSAPITTAAASGTSFFITTKTLRPTASWSAGALTNETTVASVGMMIVCSPPL